MPLVDEVMTDNCECVGEHDSVRDAARRLATLDVGSMPICGEDDRLKGMITDRDIAVKVVAQERDPSQTEVGALAEGTPIWIEAGSSLDRAIALMSEHGVRRLPVIEDKRLVGIVSQADIARATNERESGELVSSISEAPANN